MSFLFSASMCVFSNVMYAAQSYFCPQNHAYINVGMTQAQVVDACGEPTTIQNSNNPVVKQTPVTQLFFTNLNRGAIYQGYTPVYSMWSLPSGSTGSSVEVDVVNNKVQSIQINGSTANALTLCGGTGVQIGDPVNDVFSACGSPSMVNHSFTNTPVPGSAHPAVWIYQIEYQPPINLTFVNGTLQSIN